LIQELEAARASAELDNSKNESSEINSAKKEKNPEKPTVRGPLDFFVVNKDSPRASTSTSTPTSGLFCYTLLSTGNNLSCK